MSAIAGAYDQNGRLPEDPQIQQALAVMARRGADSTSIFRNQICKIGHAVYDPSGDSRHPGRASDPESGAELFLDGILDSVDLRGSSGQRLTRELNNDPGSTLESLRGDFALVLWCPSTQRLLLARDHLGTRPLCVARENGRVLFASTPRAVVTLGHAPAVDLEAIYMALRLGLVPAPWSGWAGIERLRPGEYLEITRDGLERRPFCQLELAAHSPLRESEQVKRLRRGLEETIAEQLAGVTDPIFCMSGGIDSTAIAGMARKILGRRIRTVVVGFKGQQGDDRPFARIASKHLDTEHHEIEVTAEMVDEHLEQIVDMLEVPSLLSFTEYFLTKEVAHDTKMLVTGEMADSQFGGTSPFMLLRWLSHYQRAPQGLRRRLASLLLRHLPTNAEAFGKHPMRVLQTMHTADVATASDRYLSIRQIHSDQDARALLRGSAPTPELVNDYLDPIGNPYENRAMDAMLAFHTLHEAPNEYLADDFKLAEPVVYRSPYASQRVANIAAEIPVALKVKGSVRKHVLIEAVRDVLPPETLTRPKMGFSLPMNEWLVGPLRHRLERHLNGEGLPEFFDGEIVQKLRSRFLQSPNITSDRPVLQVLLLSMWAKRLTAGRVDKEV
jgi:asparagine synthase (glutamine-hydrolysing)